MLAVAVEPAEVEELRFVLAAYDAEICEVLSPSDVRRVVLASTDPMASERIAVALRAYGWMAVSRPDGGQAAQAWMQRTEPINIADRFAVCLAWSEHDRRELPELIELGPGGFGSGHHPTTKMLMEQLVDHIDGGERVIDVGCGSGILALAALRLGAAHAVAVDLKPEAVAATRRNAELNGLEQQISATSRPLEAITDTFDVVVANIARAGIAALASELVAKVSDQGWLAVSGITPQQVDQVGGLLEPLRSVEHHLTDDWAALVLQH